MNNTCLGLDAAPGWFRNLAGVRSSYHFHFLLLGFLLQRFEGHEACQNLYSDCNKSISLTGPAQGR